MLGIVLIDLAFVHQFLDYRELIAGERVRASVATYRFRAVDGRQVTCSVGVVTFPDHAQKRDDLVELADRAA